MNKQRLVTRLALAVAAATMAALAATTAAHANDGAHWGAPPPITDGINGD